jgi:hypothetical protein
MKKNKRKFQATIEFEYSVPAGSDVLTEMGKCVSSTARRRSLRGLRRLGCSDSLRATAGSNLNKLATMPVGVPDKYPYRHSVSSKKRGPALN